MAFREMLINAIEHGGGLDPNQQVEISYLRARHMVTCRISDPGEGFTLDEIPHAAIANPDDDKLRHVEYREARGMRPGGFGVLLAQKLVDQLVYNEQGNEVMLIKYLDLESLATVCKERPVARGLLIWSLFLLHGKEKINRKTDIVLLFVLSCSGVVLMLVVGIEFHMLSYRKRQPANSVVVLHLSY